jgi:uncharacterized membrane protein YedE/YeeE
MPTSWLLAALGGAVIGTAAALLLVSQGRIAGISGILGATLRLPAADSAWRVSFVAGLLVAGAVAALFAPAAIGASPRSLPLVAVAGLLVGAGTRAAGGCTSGHGVCGVARLSRRSLVAVATFMLTGALTVWIVGAR